MTADWSAKCTALRALLAASSRTTLAHPISIGSGELELPSGKIKAPPVGGDPAAEARDLWIAVGEAGLSADESGRYPLEVRATAEVARVGAGGERAVLIFTIAAVQEFVAAARRTQDLWFGSYFFSWLMWHAMRAVAEKVGWDVFLLPTLQGQPLLRWHLASTKSATADVLIANIPNIFTALVPGADAASLARRAEAALWEARDGVFAAVKRWIERGANSQWSLATDDSWKHAWERQCRQFLQPNVFWVTVPVGERSYAEGSRRAASLLAARKTLRQFFQEPEPGQKCTLCGLRSVLHPSGRDSYREVRTFWEALAGIDRDQTGPSGRGVKLIGRIRQGERLCAVCVTKRLALEAFFLEAFFKGELGVDYHLFPSTATVATAPFARRLLEKASKNTDLAKKLQAFATEIRAVLGPAYHAANPVPQVEAAADGIARDFSSIDGQWLYPDSWTEDALRAENISDASANGRSTGGGHRVEAKASDLAGRAERGGTAARGLQEEAKNLGLGAPSAYFAIVAADGDEMGKWITGEKWITDPNRASRSITVEYHASLAVALRDFSLHLARTAVEQETSGKLVYAGGDDVLALLPVEDVLPALRWLRGFFRGVGVPNGRYTAAHGFVTGPAADARRYLVMGPKADISAGVVIAHHSHPLAHAVEEAHRVLKDEAKGTYDRRSVVFRLMRRSGEDLTTGLPWEMAIGGTVDDVLALFAEIVEVMSGRTPSLSPSLAHDMRREGPGVEMLPREAQIKLLDYLLRRRPAVRRSDASLEQATRLLTRLLDAKDSSRWPENGERRVPAPWAHAADLFELARFMASRGAPGEGGS